MLKTQKIQLSRPIFLLLAALAAALVVASPASASTTLGKTTGTMDCGSPETNFQSAFPGVQFTPEGDGVITSWSYEAPPAAKVKPVEFKVARPAGGKDLTIIGQSPVENPKASSVNTFPVQIPVKAGDLIGLFMPQGGHCGVTGDLGSEWLRIIGPADKPVGDTSTYEKVTQVVLDVAANVEPDCDGDGRGDETQDADLSPCFPAPPATAKCGGQTATIIAVAGGITKGTAGLDIIVGTSGDDTIRGLGGNDLICGLGGSDTLKSDAGNDVILGVAGDDTLVGGAGKDRVVGGAGADRLRGDGGQDKLSGGAGRDKLVGGRGRDILSGGAGFDLQRQ